MKHAIHQIRKKTALCLLKSNSGKSILGLILLWSLSENAFTQVGVGVPIGVLVSPPELAEIKSKAMNGIEPYA